MKTPPTWEEEFNSLAKDEYDRGAAGLPYRIWKMRELVKNLLTSHEATIRQEIGERVFELTQENNYSTAYGDYTEKKAIHEEATTQGYNLALRDVLAIINPTP